jgi:hypothetical protein
MQGVEQPLIQHPFSPQGLEAPKRLLYPAYSPLRGKGWPPSPPPCYVPGPQSEGTARVVLSDDYYLGPVWDEYRPQGLGGPEDVFDVPAEQRDRWQATRDAYAAIQEEIRVLMEARREAPQPVKRGAYIPQP